jgi:hypothetical protein
MYFTVLPPASPGESLLPSPLLPDPDFAKPFDRLAGYEILQFEELADFDLAFLGS